MTEPLIAAAVTAAEAMPAGAIHSAAASVDVQPRWSPAAGQLLVAADPAGGAALRLVAVADAWAAHPALPGAAVAAALRAAALAVARQRSETELSLVWTGPPTSEIGLRSTRAVLNGMVAEAERSVVLVSYAGYDVDDLVTSLAVAVERGVEIVLILETSADGGLTVDAAEAFRALRGSARFYRWPLEQRDPRVSGAARLHAKCAIRDQCEVLVTSANLTGAAINDNMELGVVIRSAAVAGRLHRHFRLLIEDGVLELA